MQIRIQLCICSVAPRNVYIIHNIPQLIIIQHVTLCTYKYIYMVKINLMPSNHQLKTEVFKQFQHIPKIVQNIVFEGVYNAKTFDQGMTMVRRIYTQTHGYV